MLIIVTYLTCVATLSNACRPLLDNVNDVIGWFSWTLWRDGSKLEQLLWLQMVMLVFRPSLVPRLFLLSRESLGTRLIQTFLYILPVTNVWWRSGSGGFRAARLPGQATRAARAVSLWVEKNPVPPPNRWDWLVVLTVGRLCPIIPQDTNYSGKRTIDQNFTRAMPGSGTAYEE